MPFAVCYFSSIWNGKWPFRSICGVNEKWHSSEKIPTSSIVIVPESFIAVLSLHLGFVLSLHLALRVNMDILWIKDSKLLSNMPLKKKKKLRLSNLVTCNRELDIWWGGRVTVSKFPYSVSTFLCQNPFHVQNTLIKYVSRIIRNFKKLSTACKALAREDTN